MRLIDADKLKINLYHNKKVVLNDDLVKCIDDTETAYDIDKVVEKLKELEGIQFDGENESYQLNWCIETNRAIEIVKQGGVSDDVCEWKYDCHLENDNPSEWLICPHNPKRIFSKDIKYCPYCGKKIKVVK